MYLDSRYRIHLMWMFDNQPSLVREYLRKGKLKDYLDKKEQRALSVVLDLKENRGMSEEEAFEIAMYEVLAPPDGPETSDDPPKPMPYPERQAVYRKLEALAEDEEI